MVGYRVCKLFKICDTALLIFRMSDRMQEQFVNYSWFHMSMKIFNSFKGVLQVMHDLLLFSVMNSRKMKIPVSRYLPSIPIFKPSNCLRMLSYIVVPLEKSAAMILVWTFDSASGKMNSHEYLLNSHLVISRTCTFSTYYVYNRKLQHNVKYKKRLVNH